MRKINTLVIFLFCLSVPIDFLTGRLLSGISASTIFSAPIILFFIFDLVLKKEIYLPKALLILILIPCLGLPQLVINSNYPLDRIAAYIYYLTTTIAVVNLAVNYKIKTNILIISSTIGVLIMSIYLLTEGTIGYGGTRLATTTRDLNPNNASGFILLGIATSIWMLSIYSNKLLKAFGGLTLVIFALVLLLLQSKTSFIAITVALFFTLFLKIFNQHQSSKRLDFKKIVINFFKLFIFLGLGYYILNKVLENFNISFSSLNRINDLFSGNLDSATTGRSDIWENAFSHPNFILGTGFLSFREEYARKAHSVYVSTFMETGIVGILLLISFYIALLFALKNMIKSHNNEIYTYGFIVVFLIMFGFGNEIMEFKFFWQGLIIIHLIRYDSKLKKIKNGASNNNENKFNDFTWSISSK